MSHIQSDVGTGEDDGVIRDQKELPSEEDWWSRLSSHSAWPWVIVCVVIVLSLCIALILVSRNSTNSRKQMSDLDVLDNYKQGFYNNHPKQNTKNLNFLKTQFHRTTAIHWVEALAVAQKESDV